MVNCDQAIEHSYCCGTSNGTLTLDGVNGVCDCDAFRGSSQPLHFEGNATAITTINVPESTTFQIFSTTPTPVVPVTSSTPSSSSSSAFPIASSSPSQARQSLIVSESLEASSIPSVRSSSSIPHPSDKRGVIIGVTVGITTPLLSVAVLGFLRYRSKRKNRGPPLEINTNEYATDLNKCPDGQHELLASTGEQELQASLNYQELPVDGSHK